MRPKTLLPRRKRRKRRAGQLSGIWRGVRILCAFFLKLGFALVILGLISLTFVFTYGYLLTSPYIRLEEVEVPGVDDDFKAQILELAQLNYDYSLLAVDLNGVKKRVQKHPWIRSVEVEKRFPHMLIIRVEKQKPLALALQGRLYYMNPLLSGENSSNRR
jgi:cell division protein FtsQ